MSSYRRAKTASMPVSLSGVPASKPSPGSGFRSRLFGSPKKAKTASMPPSSVPPPDPFDAHLSSDGSLGNAQIDFEQCRAQCIGKRTKFSFPLISPASGKQVGNVDTHMFYLPPLAPLSTQLWPKSMDECQEGMRLLQKSGTEQRIILKGELSQVGADCKVSETSILRRRGPWFADLLGNSH